jgi:hypothetical protein
MSRIVSLVVAHKFLSALHHPHFLAECAEIRFSQWRLPRAPMCFVHQRKGTRRMNPPPLVILHATKSLVMEHHKTYYRSKFMVVTTFHSHALFCVSIIPLTLYFPLSCFYSKENDATNTIANDSVASNAVFVVNPTNIPPVVLQEAHLLCPPVFPTDDAPSLDT